ncbi:O-antigen ligase family protein [Sphingomonas sp. BK580]|uniref:O-antigen ligase family protein n=1 Tax=Sphingomonas sp. BK580 TaxID=2586972 RepID=UPI0016206EF1|nr:O-antigen ligase family protein [Sphingomonas sp. BK580]MBB3693789.1 O-antigen ligase [Sphingomonas sp. BK580]
MAAPTSFFTQRPSMPLVLFYGFLFTLWIAGGASRAEVYGQIVVRLAAIGALIACALFVDLRGPIRIRPIGWLLVAVALLAVVQLAPLPPLVWQALPGRALLAGAAMDGPQPWRPISMTPGATMNALASLIVPLATLVLVSVLKPGERRILPSAILVMIVASTLLGLLQLSGASFNNPFINDTPGQMSSSFANRNHFALLLALGCLLIPAWVFSDRQHARVRAAVGVGLALLFLLMILAAGSRAGMLLGALALALALLVAQGPIRRALRRAPRWAFPGLLALVVVLVSAFVLISIAADRASSVQRLFDVDPGQDMRHRALPTIWSMTTTYFPFGSGLGGFDPLFRVHEPMALLKPTYFNHAHNDVVEVILDAGLPALILLVLAVAWWCRASARVWVGGSGADAMLPKIGSAMLLLIGLASGFDYPARTPMIMALIVVAAVWLDTDATRAAD